MIMGHTVLALEPEGSRWITRGRSQGKTRRTEETGSELLSLPQVARELGISTAFLSTNLLDAGAIPFDESSPQPQVLRRDLENYKAERDRRKKLLTELTQETQDLELGYYY